MTLCEQLYEISRTAIRIDDTHTSNEVVEAMRVFCEASIDVDSPYLGGFRYLGDIGTLALDHAKGIVHAQLLLSVSHLFSELILSAKQKDRNTHAMFSIMQFFILGSFYNSNHESIANHIVDVITSVCSQREVEVAYTGLTEKKETLRSYFGGEDPQHALSDFYDVLMA